MRVLKMGKATTRFGRPKWTKNSVDNKGVPEVGKRPVLVSDELVRREEQSDEENKSEAWKGKRMLERKEGRRVVQETWKWVVEKLFSIQKPLPIIQPLKEERNRKRLSQAQPGNSLQDKNYRRLMSTRGPRPTTCTVSQWTWDSALPLDHSALSSDTPRCAQKGKDIHRNRTLNYVLGWEVSRMPQEFIVHEEFHNLYASPNITRVIKWRRLGWVGHVARVGGNEKCIQYFGWKIRREETTRKT